jgi:hypothetical protein
MDWFPIVFIIAFIPLWRVVICLSATVHMIVFTRLAGFDFDAPKFFIRSLTHSLPGGNGVVRIVDGRTQSIKSYVTIGFRMSMEHRLAISVKSQAQPGTRLKVIPNRSWFGQPKNYFGDSWDKKLIVQSTPRDFGLKLFESEHLRSQVYNVLLGDRLFPELASSLIISRTGTVTLHIHGKFWNPWRTISLLALVDSIAINVS